MHDILSGKEVSAEEALAGRAEITPLQLKALLDKNPDIYLLDVREPDELAICRIAKSRNIPLGILPLRYSEVPRERPVIVLCKMGGRSAQAIQFLKGKGYDNLTNLAGGILRWIDEVDPSLKKY